MNRKAYQLIIILSIVCAVYICFIPFAISQDLEIYAIGWLHAWNPELFVHNLFIAEQVISPRFVMDFIYSGIMRLNGGDWLSIVMVMLWLNILIITLATVRIVMQLCDRHQAFYALVFALLLSTRTYPVLAGFYTFDAANAGGLALGLSFAVLALSFCIGKQKNFNLAWIFVALAALCHVHEGLYGFLTIFLLSLVDGVRERKGFWKRNLCVLFSVAAILIVTLPSLLTDTMPIGNKEFVEIYAFFRHPHHLVPSAWKGSQILVCFLVIAVGGILRTVWLFLREKEEWKLFAMEAGVFLLAWLGVLGLTYLFTEIRPLAAVSTMFLPKFFKYVTIMSLIWYLETVSEFLSWKGFRLYPAAFLLLAGWLFFRRFHNIEPRIFFLFIGLFLVAGEAAEGLAKPVLKYMTGALSLMLVVLSVMISSGSFREGTWNPASPKERLISDCTQDIYDLAVEFERRTETADAYLADPADTRGAGWFQVLSGRNCYVLYKVIPSSKSKIKDWYDRYQQAAGLFDRESSKICRLMQKEGIEYLLVNRKYYDKIEADENFDCFLTAGDDSYRIYRVATVSP